MKILLCSHEYPPMGSGIAYVTMHLAKALERRGHRVTVCSPIGPGIAAGSKRLIEAVGGFGILHFWWRVSRLLKRRRYDLVWAQNPLFLSRRPDKFLGTVHTTYLERSRAIGGASLAFRCYNAIMRAFERRCYRAMSGQRFTVTSNRTLAELGELGITGSIPIVSNGVDASRFKPGRKAGLRRELGLGSGRVFLNVGRMMPQKRQHLLVRIFLEFGGKADRLVIVGDGPLRRELEAASDSRVILMGLIGQAELLKQYQAADYFIMPSSYEGQPLALLEAMACGLVPILSNIPIFADTLASVKCGLLVDFESSSAAAKIAGFIEKPGYTQISERLSRRVRRDYDWQRIAADYERVIG